MLKVKCPTCKEPTFWEDNPYRPFCSERCKQVDLGNWADGSYSLPSEEESPSINEDDEIN
ncbi:MAG: DNA gyrase inhibitor YacG [SAR324 cluster bacterium]|nr:DNA gyrase inhibitor YacG [SAR324 cluster bacterium]